MKLFEIFDSAVKLAWVVSGNTQLTKFGLDEKEYIIQCRLIKLPGFPKRTAEFSFFRADVHGSEHGTTGDVGFPVKIYGVLYHALQEKYRTDYDVLAFIAERRHSESDKQFSSKVNIYTELAQLLVKKEGGFFYDHVAVSGVDFVLSSSEIADSRFVNSVQEAILQINSFPKI